MVEEDGETTIDGAEDVLDMESIESDIAAKSTTSEAQS
jgi:hypothetical protein